MSESVNWPARLALWLALLTALLLVILGPGYRLGWLDLSLVFRKLFPVVTWVAAGAAALALIGLVTARGGRGGAVTAIVALAVAAAAASVPLGMRYQSRQVPPIHDISTDLIDPPRFEATAKLRKPSENPPDYAGGETANAQRGAYPDLQTIRIRKPATEVFQAAQAVVMELGWALQAADPETGIIEATDTTAWFGFRDDVVIRIRAAPSVTEVDVRSKSRVGVSDLGANADRIRAFRDRLVGRLL